MTAATNDLAELPQLAEPGCCIVCHKHVELYNNEYYLLDGGYVAHVAEPCGSKAVELRPCVPVRVKDQSLYSTIVIPTVKFFADVLPERMRRRRARQQMQKVHARKRGRT